MGMPMGGMGGMGGRPVRRMPMGGGDMEMMQRFGGDGGPAPMQPPMQLPPPQMMTPGQMQQQDAIRRMMDQQLEMYRPKFKHDIMGPGTQYGDDMSPPMEIGDEMSVLAPDSPVQPSGGNMTPEQRIRKLLQNREGRVR